MGATLTVDGACHREDAPSQQLCRGFGISPDANPLGRPPPAVARNLGTKVRDEVAVPRASKIVQRIDFVGRVRAAEAEVRWENESDGPGRADPERNPLLDKEYRDVLKRLTMGR